MKYYVELAKKHQPVNSISLVDLIIVKNVECFLVLCK